MRIVRHNLKILILIIFIILLTQNTVFATIESPPEDYTKYNPFENLPLKIPLNIDIKDIKADQIFNQLQKTIEDAFKGIIYQIGKALSLNIEKQTQREVMKQKKNIYESFEQINASAKKYLESINKYFQSFFNELKWKIFTPKY